MNICRSCFTSHANPIDVLARPSVSIAPCGFCDATPVEVWPAAAFRELFETLIGVYPPAKSAGPDSAAHIRLQADWAIFSSSSPAVWRAILEEVFTGDPLGGPGDIDPLVALDHAEQWNTFAAEVTRVNRYFPKSELHLGNLSDVIAERQREISPGTSMFRARVHANPTPFEVHEMGMPPAALATEGRANPLGIPHLYLALDEMTCIKESRATQHSFVTIATFRVHSPVKVLDLAHLRPPNPFLSLDDELGRILDNWRLLERLGAELSKPVRTGDNKIDYIPTQYLSEYVKWLGLEGILYSSSLHSGGQNVVLFRDSDVKPEPNTKLIEVTGTTVTFEPR